MHELFTQVLGNRDLSRAGDLFSVSDTAIVNDLTQVLTEITSIASLPDYAHNDNDQSVVEICVTRVTSCIRETGSVEQHCEALVNLLESCLHHNLQPSARDEDPPHAKICSDIISCIFLNYSKKSVMERALPIAVKFLHKGNKELSRNMASYLSLAAIDHATLLSPHVQPIMDSIISGNYPLCRVLAQIYEVSHEPLQGHTMALVSLLPLCDNQEKLALLNLFSLIAKNTPALLEASVPQLCEYLNSTVTAAATLQVFLQLAEKRPTLLVDHVAAMKLAAHKHPHTVCLAAQVIAAVGKLSKDKAQDALNFVLEHLPKADRGSQSTLLREATLLCSSYPVLFTDKVLAGVRQRHHTSTNQVNQTEKNNTNNNNNNNQVNQTSGGVTIVKVGGNVQNPPSTVNTQVAPPTTVQPVVGYTRRAKLGDSRSTGRLHTATNTNTHRRGSVGGLHKSMTRLSSSQQINSVPPPPPTTTTASSSSSSSSTTTSHNVVPTPPLSNSVIVTGTSKWGIPNIGPTRVSSGGVTVTTISPPRLPRPLSQGPLTFGLQSSSGHISTGAVTVANSQITINPSHLHLQQNINSGAVTVNSIYSSPSSTGHISVVTSSSVSNPISHSIPVGSSSLITDSGPVSLTSVNPVSISGPTTVTSRRNNNTSVTILNANNHGAAASQRMSVFEPYPMRDTVQHFCEKHLDKIKAYMDKVSVRIPPPAKCTIEERRAKKMAKLHFACQTRGQHCLYSRTFFTMRTRNPRIWIHLMFIALQARSPHALSSRDASVSSLKHCWDMLKCENKTFLTLVTSAFPCAKDQEILLNELRHSGFFDVFQLGPASMGGSANQLEGTTLQWGCFLCTHPERAVGFLRGNTQPVIEGQLKEKKGKWRLFRRWRTRYFTLSGAHLSCRGSSGGESIDVNQIRSVKVSRGARNIPKAFEIFTGNQSLIFKPKDGKNAEEWVQCLSIVVAHSHAREIPVKSNSLPARGISNSKIPI